MLTKLLRIILRPPRTKGMLRVALPMCGLMTFQDTVVGLVIGDLGLADGSGRDQ